MLASGTPQVTLQGLPFYLPCIHSVVFTFDYYVALQIILKLGIKINFVVFKEAADRFQTEISGGAFLAP